MLYIETYVIIMFISTFYIITTSLYLREITKVVSIT